MPKKRTAPVPEWSRRLAELRRSTGLSQEEFGYTKVQEYGETRIRPGVIDLSAGAVKRLEVGDLKLTDRILQIYADHFHCLPEYITGGTKYKNRVEELLSRISEPEELRMDVAVALQAWVASRLPGEKLNKIDLFAVQEKVFGYVEEEIRKAED